MALFDDLAKRIEQRSSDWAEGIRRVAEEALAECPGISVHHSGDELIISGHGLIRRWIGDVRLRFALWRAR